MRGDNDSRVFRIIRNDNRHLIGKFKMMYRVEHDLTFRPFKLASYDTISSIEYRFMC